MQCRWVPFLSLLSHSLTCSNLFNFLDPLGKLVFCCSINEFFFGLTWAVARAGAIDLILTASRWECCLRFVGGWCRLTIQKWLMHQMFHIRLLYIKMRNWHCRVLKKKQEHSFWMSRLWNQMMGFLWAKIWKFLS